MNRKVISVSIICMMLTASFVIAGMTVGKSKVKHVTGSSQKKPDPPDTISGAKNPEMIPDRVAYVLIFRTIATPQGTEFEKARSRAWTKRLGLGFDEATGGELIKAANEFATQVKPLDQQAHEIKNRTWPNPDAATMAQLAALQAQKEALVNQIVASLPARLGQEQAGKLHLHMTNRLKAKMKIAPVSANPIAKHH